MLPNNILLERAFRDAPRNGERFRSLVAEKRRELPPSILILTTQGQILTRSSAVLHILERLGGGRRVMAMVGRMVPAGTRDVRYRFIARGAAWAFALASAESIVCP